MIFDEVYQLEKIPPYLLSKIITRMDNNESWKKIQRLPDLFGVVKPPETNKKSTPSEYILSFLIEKLCTMGQLKDILYKSQIYDALSIFYTEKLKIETQPTAETDNNELIVKRKTNFELEFKVWGIPEPTYQWYKNDEPLPDQISSKLFYESYSPEMEGDYYCIATQTLENHLTNVVTTENVQSDFVSVLTRHEKCILTKVPLTDITRKVGDPHILLEVVADGYPTPRYQWSHDNEVIQTRNKFKIKTTIDNTGIYRCHITNGINELVVVTSVKIIDPNYKCAVSLEPVTEKVALLIGNDHYKNLSELSTPTNDTKNLQEKLESIGFLVLNVNNLTLNGMLHALNFFKQMVCRDSIALFYYAGHGFEMGEKYLMPIDVPLNYRTKDCMCEYRIFKEVLQNQPRLFVVLLDMCLSHPNRNENPEIFEDKKTVYPYATNRNLLRGYATSTGYNSQGMKNKFGLYNSLLLKSITSKIPIHQMLNAINNEFEELVKDSGKPILDSQMPTVTSNLSKDYYLDVGKTGNPASKQILDRLQTANKPNRNIQ